MGKKDTPQVLILLGHVRSKLEFLIFFYGIITEDKVAQLFILFLIFQER